MVLHYEIYALSFYRSLKSRPCGFGQSLGRPIVRSISHFFWSTKEKFVQYQIFFVHSLEFFVQSFLKMWFWSVSWPTNCPINFSFFEKDWTKNSREWTKISESGQIFFCFTKKIEKQTGQLVDQETDQNHMEGTLVSSPTSKVTRFFFLESSKFF